MWKVGNVGEKVEGRVGRWREGEADRGERREVIGEVERGDEVEERKKGKVEGRGNG